MQFEETFYYFSANGSYNDNILVGVSCHKINPDKLMFLAIDDEYTVYEISDNSTFEKTIEKYIQILENSGSLKGIESYLNNQ